MKPLNVLTGIAKKISYKSMTSRAPSFLTPILIILDGGEELEFSVEIVDRREVKE